MWHIISNICLHVYYILTYKLYNIYRAKLDDLPFHFGQEKVVRIRPMNHQVSPLSLSSKEGCQQKNIRERYTRLTPSVARQWHLTSHTFQTSSDSIYFSFRSRFNLYMPSCPSQMIMIQLPLKSRHFFLHEAPSKLWFHKDSQCSPSQLMVNCWFGLLVWNSRGIPK